MPLISAFYGIAVYMYYTDRVKHYRPHIHIRYGEFEAVFAIDDGSAIRGVLLKSQTKLIQAWIEIHKTELMYDWELASTNRQLCKIDPLK